MTDTALAGASADSAAAKRPARTSTRPAAKPNGQWKVDGTAPLNGNEEWKQVDDGLSVRERIENIYSKGGFASIDPTDLHGRFRWWGLYTQRKPGHRRRQDRHPRAARARRRVLHAARAHRRRRSSPPSSCASSASISTEFGRDTADLTDRQNIQLHWIRVEDVPEIWRRLEAVGLGTTEACGDVPRVILGSPGRRHRRRRAHRPDPADRRDHRAASSATRRSRTCPASSRPRSPATPARTSCTRSTTSPSSPSTTPSSASATTCGSAAASRPAPRLAERLGVFVAPEQVADAWHGVAQIFRDYGYRRLRNKARLKFLLADWGTEKFRQVLEDEYLGYALPDGPAAPKPTTPGDHVGVHRQKDGRFYVGVTPIVGRVSGPHAREARRPHRGARLARACAPRRTRSS